MAETIEMPFRIAVLMDPGKRVIFGVQMPQRERALLDQCLAHSIAYDFVGFGKRELCKTVGLMLTIYTSYDELLHKEVPLRVSM